MGQALYRKYRSKSLAEIVGQDHITRTLEQAIKQGRISHAYLFTGPRGVGKTSIARILAHQINNLAYDDSQTHMDIIEIDAASNRRIDEIRDLRDKVYIAPAQAKYKVYIIDEVHMLTREAFNALLKTLEEPPAHAVFILATTELHKLPATIVSRTQRFTFKPIKATVAAAHLQTIASEEGITISQEALELLAEHGDGSFRDSISLLDQAAGQGIDVTADSVRQMIGIPPRQAISDLAKLLEGANATDLMHALNALYDQGYQAVSIAKQLASIIRNNMIQGAYTGTALALLTQLLEVPTSHDPERFLEIALLTALPADGAAAQVHEPSVNKPSTPVKPHSPKTESTPTVTPSPSVSLPALSDEEQSTPEAIESPKQVKKPVVVSGSGGIDEASWGHVLQELKKQYNTLYSIARMAQINFIDDKTVELTFKFAFHQKRMSESKNHQILSDALLAITGSHITVVCLVNASATPAKVATSGNTTPPAEPLSAISNIFGGGELLESEQPGE